VETKFIQELLSPKLVHTSALLNKKEKSK